MVFCATFLANCKLKLSNSTKNKITGTLCYQDEMYFVVESRGLDDISPANFCVLVYFDWYVVLWQMFIMLWGGEGRGGGKFNLPL